MATAARQLSYERTTAIVARALGISTAALEAAFGPAGTQHLAQVVELRKRALDTPVSWDDSRYLTWRYHFGSNTSGRGECWIVLRGEQVVGMTGTENIDLLCEEQATPTLSTMDIAVHPDFEGAGLGAWMAISLARRARCAITIGSNAKSRNMILSLFAPLPGRRSYIHALDFHRFFARRVRPRPLANSLAVVAGAVMNVWRKLLPGAADAAIEIREIRQFDSSIDELFQRSRVRSEVWIRRSAEQLNWRLFGNPRVRYSAWGAYLRGELIGYWATQDLNQHRTRDALGVVDWLVDQQHAGRVFLTLLRYTLQRASAGGADFVCVTAYHRRSEKYLRRCGFFRQRNEFETVALLGSDAPSIERLQRNNAWFIGEIDTDRDGM